METDIAVIGAGIMGSSTAYQLASKTRQKILLIEKYGLVNDYCASNDANRVFRYAYGSDGFYTGLAVRSLALWREVERETEQELLVPSGLLLVQGENEKWNRFNAESHATLARMDLEAEAFSKGEIRRRYPQFKADQAFFDPHGAAILASKALRAFINAAERRGVKLLSDTEITRIQTGERRLTLETERGQTIKAKKLVLATGYWSNQLLPPGLVRVSPTRQQLVYFRPSHLVNYAPEKFPVFFVDEFYGIPAAGIDAVKISHMGRDQKVDPTSANRQVNSEEVETCRGVAGRFLPEIAASPVAQGKVCLYDMTPDSDFVIGADQSDPRIIYGYGFSGHGFKFAPLIGQTLSQLALGDAPGFDLARFDPMRGTNTA